MTVEELESQALLLSPEQRADLADRLLASLGPANLTEAEEAWVEEADRRFQEYKEGRIPSRPGDEVFRDAFDRFQ